MVGLSLGVDGLPAGGAVSRAGADGLLVAAGEHAAIAPTRARAIRIRFSMNASSGTQAGQDRRQ